MSHCCISPALNLDLDERRSFMTVSLLVFFFLMPSPSVMCLFCQVALAWLDTYEDWCLAELFLCCPSGWLMDRCESAQAKLGGLVVPVFADFGGCGGKNNNLPRLVTGQRLWSMSKQYFCVIYCNLSFQFKGHSRNIWTKFGLIFGCLGFSILKK